MKKHVKLTLICSIVYSVVIIVSLNASAELIEPTRTLDGTPTFSRISVFSGAAEIAVSLNGEMIGFTPVRSHQVKPGSYLLSIGGSRKEINLLEGQIRRFSYYEDHLIELVSKPEISPAPSQAKSAPDTNQRAVKKSRTKEVEFDQPLYWPLNPKGQIF